MRKEIKDIALAVGGSHYPDVGGDLLQRFADTLIAKCIELIEQAPTASLSNTTWDKSISDATKEFCIENIKKNLM